MIDTAFVSVEPDLDTRQIDTFIDLIFELGHTPEWQRWLAQPEIKTASRTWLIRDIEKSKFVRTRHGTNLHLSVREVVEADQENRLAEWVEGWIYAWAVQTSDLVGADRPEGSTR